MAKKLKDPMAGHRKNYKRVLEHQIEINKEPDFYNPNFDEDEKKETHQRN